MARIGLAFRCFFKLLFGGDLPADAVRYLPEGAAPRDLPAADADRRDTSQRPEDEARGKGDGGGKAEASAGGAARTDSPRPQKTTDAGPTRDTQRDGALAFLALLQREGRLIDFLRESLDDYDDSDIGAAVRDIHRGCKKVIDEHLKIEPVMPGDEESDVTVPRGFDPGEIRLLGESSGEPPFRGVLRHHGWRVTRVSLPTLSDGVDRRVLAPAEVEVK